MLRQAAAGLVLVLAGAAGVLSAPAQPSTPAQPSAPVQPSTPTVTVRDGKVSAALQQAPLDAVIAAIADETGAEVRGGTPEREVTLRLDAVPLEDALERLLGSHGFTLTYDADGHLKRITLSTAGEAGPASKAPTATAGPSSTENPATEAGARMSEYIRGNPTVEVGGRLGRALGTNTATFQDVIREALKNDDPRVRAEGRRAMVKTLVSDPSVRDALVATLDGMPDDALARTLRSVAGADAEQLAVAFARYGRSAALSQRMQRAMIEIRRQGDGS